MATPSGATVGEDVIRFANVNFPNKVLLTEKRVTLLIQVARKHEEFSVVTADESRMSLKLAPAHHLGDPGGL